MPPYSLARLLGSPPLGPFHKRLKLQAKLCEVPRAAALLLREVCFRHPLPAMNPLANVNLVFHASQYERTRSSCSRPNPALGGQSKLRERPVLQPLEKPKVHPWSPQIP